MHCNLNVYNAVNPVFMVQVHIQVSVCAVTGFVYNRFDKIWQICQILEFYQQSAP